MNVRLQLVWSQSVNGSLFILFSICLLSLCSRWRLRRGVPLLPSPPPLPPSARLLVDPVSASPGWTPSTRRSREKGGFAVEMKDALHSRMCFISCFVLWICVPEGENGDSAALLFWKSIRVLIWRCCPSQQRSSHLSSLWFSRGVETLQYRTSSIWNSRSFSHYCSSCCNREGLQVFTKEVKLILLQYWQEDETGSQNSRTTTRSNDLTEIILPKVLNEITWVWF